MAQSRLTHVDIERLIDFVAAGFIILTDEGTIDYINDFAAGALAAPTESLIGQNFWKSLSSAQDSEIRRRLVEAVKSGEPSEFEARAPQTGRWVRIHVFPSVDSTVIHFVDITLTKQSTTRLEVERAVAMELAEASSLREAAPGLIARICEKLELDAGGLWLPDAQGRELHCVEFGPEPSTNRVHQQLADASKKAAFSPGEGLSGRVWQQKRAIGLVHLPEEIELSRVAGVKNPFQSGFAFPMLVDGECLGVLEFFARRLMTFHEPKLGMMNSLGHEIGHAMVRWQAQRSVAAEEAMRSAVLKSALDAIIIMDADGNIQGFNPAAERLFGYQADEVLGKSLSACIIPEQFRERHERGYRRYMRTGEQHILGKRIEIQAMRADGSEFPCELAITQAHIAGQPPTFVGYVRDITARRQAEQSLIQAREQAEQMTRLKSSLLANMSHEIRTPLTSMMIWTTVLRESAQDVHLLTETQRRALGTIERSAQRLADTLDSILTLAQLAGRGLSPEMQPLMLADMASGMVEELKTLAEQKGLEISLDIQTESSQIMADPVFLNRVLANIASNAVKFTPRGSISVVVSADDEQVFLTVRDTGVGIDAEFIPSIFEDFVQESSGFARAYEGSGLGLAISKRLLEAMQAEIAIESRKTQGTTVTLSFNRAPVKAEEIYDDEPDTMMIFDDLPESKHRILIVEDNADIRIATAEALSSLAEVSAFRTAEEALKSIRGEEFDLILMDISLPGIDGMEALSTLRKYAGFERVPAIALTGHAMPGDREYLMRRGFSDYLAKPFQIKGLLKQVGRWLPAVTVET